MNIYFSYVGRYFGVVRNPFIAFKNLSFSGIVCALSERSEFAHARKKGDSCDRVPFSLVLFLLGRQKK